MQYKRIISSITGILLSFGMTFTGLPLTIDMPVFAVEDTFISSEFTETDIKQIVSDAALDSGDLAAEVVDISVTAGNSIDEKASVNESKVGDSAVSSHDWSAYVSDTLPSRLSTNERKLYDAFDDVLSTYLNNSNVSATPYKISSTNTTYYVTSSINYKNYGFSKTEAVAIAQMFLYNNPQYYFTSSVFLTTSNNIWFTLYPSFTNGTTRANQTNSLFTTLDNWIVLCSDYESTTYLKERSTHDMMCDYISYVIGDYDQSVYSALIQNQTVCAGYSELFSMMMNAMDIDTMVVLSDSHAWDIIELDDGNYYAVDVTWSDSLRDSAASNDRYLFNVSATNIKKYDANNEHVMASTWTSSWVPTVSSTDYVATYYDTTGVTGDSSVSLSAPDNLRGTYDDSEDSVRIYWDDVVGASSYEVEAYDYDTNTSLGSLTIKDEKHVKLASVKSRNLLVKVRAVGVNESSACYSAWSSITYIDGTFAAYKGTSNVTLSAPANFKTSDVTETSFDLSWDAVSNAAGYSLYIYKSENKQNMLASLSTKKTSVHVTGLTYSDTVYAYIRAFKSVSGVTYYSDWSVLTINLKNTETSSDSSSTETSSSVSTTVGVPTTLAYTSLGNNAVKVTWQKGTNADTTTVVVRLGTTGGTEVGRLSTANSSVKLSGLKSVQDYYVCLQSVGASTTSSWAYLKIPAGSNNNSSSTSGNSSTSTTTSSVTAPATLTYTKQTATTGTLSWTSVDSAVKYDLQIYSDSSYLTSVGTATTTNTKLKVSGTKQGKIYYARVRAIDASGNTSSWTLCSFTPGTNSSGSSSDSSSSSKTSTSTVTAPVNLTATTSNSKCHLTWTADSNVSYYVVEIYSDSSYTNKVAEAKVYSSSVNISGMSAGKTYYIRVKTVSTAGTSSLYSSVTYTKT